MRYIKRLRGFSLIELMIVVSIISILAMIAMPSYQQYTKRARFAEVIAATSIYKTAVSLALQQGIKENNISNGAYGIPAKATPSKTLASIRVKNAVITAKATDVADSATYILKPSSDGTQWAIGGTCLKYGFCND